MLFKVGDNIIDTETTPVALIFKDKEECRVVGNIIANIKNGNSEYSTENNGNWWLMFPSDNKEYIDKWSLLSEHEKSLLDKTPSVSTYINYEL
jgi:hypothetical protein